MGRWIFGVIIGIAVIVGVVSLTTKSKTPPAPIQSDTQPNTVSTFPTSSQFVNPGLQIVGQPTQQAQQQNSQPQPQPTITVVTDATQATIKTAKGDIVIQLYPQDAPKTVANFATLAKYGYYNNLTFHRVVPGFVIQGGDPKGDGTGGVSIFGPTFEDELNPNTPSYQAGYKEGVVAMANRGPNTNGSQFFIMLADDDSLPHSYTIFGKVTQGMDVVKQIVVGDKMQTIQIQESQPQPTGTSQNSQ
ncbi:MAG: peptidylprolyl isomerase [Patescibacteria group bacterium]|nr:peptidylprolyl isomerase [Patescibacteria group bacterium]